MKGMMSDTKMKPGIAKPGTAAKPGMGMKGDMKRDMKRKPMSSGGRLSPFADVSSKNPLGYGAK